MYQQDFSKITLMQNVNQKPKSEMWHLTLKLLDKIYMYMYNLEISVHPQWNNSRVSLLSFS